MAHDFFKNKINVENINKTTLIFGDFNLISDNVVTLL